MMVPFGSGERGVSTPMLRSLSVRASPRSYVFVRVHYDANGLEARSADIRPDGTDEIVDAALVQDLEIERLPRALTESPSDFFVVSAFDKQHAGAGTGR